MDMLYLLISGGLVAFIIFILTTLYKVVPPDFADVVTQSGRIRVFSAHKEYNPDGKSAYFQIPSWFFIGRLGMQVQRVPLNIITINVPNFLAFDSSRARFVVDIVAYVSVKDPIQAAKRFSGNVDELTQQASLVVQSTTRDVTTKMAIREIINNRQDIIDKVTPILSQTLGNWGVDLRTLELIDFKDPDDTSKFGVKTQVIHDISSVIETQISAEARQKNAEQLKLARVKEAEAEEFAKKREIEKDQEISKRDQEKQEIIAKAQTIATTEQLEIVKVQQVKNAEIQRAKAIVEANQSREVQEITKEKERLRGEGDQAYLEAKAKGDAAKFREEGLAQADAKEALQAALNKFEDKAIRALVAEKIVDMQTQVGVASARALERADIKAFVGSDGGQGFDLGKLVESIRVSSDSSAASVLNKLARPMDLGFTSLPQSESKPKSAKI